jgi:hypothetical protein
MIKKHRPQKGTKTIEEIFNENPDVRKLFEESAKSISDIMQILQLNHLTVS